jgi:hypothetical protein
MVIKEYVKLHSRVVASAQFIKVKIHIIQEKA